MTDKPKRTLVVTAVAATLALSACGGGESHPGSSGSPASTGPPARFSPTTCGTFTGRGCAPTGARVDLGRPSFSNPTNITNPLFPISRLHSVVLLGHVSGKPFRTETTLLPGTRTIDWNGQRVRTLVSQYVAYLDGRLDEVALDKYAQADDGSVWYFGEDVMDYRNGAIAITEGTWLAGREGPAAMIMPGRPKVGDVFRLENIPGIVFEEVKVGSIGMTVAGPRGPVKGALVADELHSDGTTDHKIYAPGYGEFRTASSGDLEALALAVPTDALPGSPPQQLESLSIAAEGILESTRVGERKAVTATLGRMTAAWKALQAANPPPLLGARLGDAMNALTRAVKARRSKQVAQGAIDVGQSVLDLKLRYRPPIEIDTSRFELWTQQLRVHAAANDLAGVTGDIAVLEWIRDRIGPALGPAGRQEIDLRLRGLRGATDARNLPAAADHAARLAERLRILAATTAG